MADKQYRVKLVQQEWVTTEVFDVAATDEKAAESKAKEIVKTKDIKTSYRLEFEEAPQA